MYNKHFGMRTAFPYGSGRRFLTPKTPLRFLGAEPPDPTPPPVDDEGLADRLWLSLPA